jgi:S-(hydroxymethyl)glutathione dehydrogenase/alcohol dehydrogenase
MLDMYTAGQLKLDEIITTSYTLDEVNQGYADMHAGRNVRGVITFGEAPGKTAPRAGEALATS